MAIRFVKYFERRKDLDFSDDGNSFRCYGYKGMEISVLKSSENGYYISAKLPKDMRLDYSFSDLDLEYRKNYDEVNKLLNIYNYGHLENEIDLELFVKGLDSALHIVKTMPTPKPTIFFNILDQKYYGYKWEKIPYEKEYSKKFSCLSYISNENICKFNVKKLVVED